MANNRWLGRAEAISEIYTITIGGTWVAADTIRVTIGGATIQLVVGTVVTTSGIAAALKAALAGNSLVGDESRNQIGSSVPQFASITFTVSGSVVTATGVAGVPFVMSVDKTSTSGTAVGSNTQDATGPNHISNSDNWSDGVPNTSDNVYVDANLPALLYDLDTITDTMASFNVAGGPGATAFGLPEINPAGYVEYLPTYLALEATVVNLGVGAFQGGASLQKLDTGSVQTTLNLYSSGQSVVQGQRAVQWKGTHASNVVNVYGGELSIAQYGGEVATVATLNAFSAQATVDVSSGVTLTTINSQDATVNLADNTFTTVTVTGGSFTVNGSQAMTNVVVHQGTFVYKSSGTITNCTAGGKGNAVITTDGDGRAKEITNMTLKRGGGVVDRGTITFPNNIAIDSSVTQIQAAA